MLDDVERRAFLVDPAGEHPVPILVGALDVDLDEGAGQLLQLPRRRRLASAQANDDVFHPDCLAGLQGDVADDAVALVEQPEDRHPLGHRRDAGQIGGRARHFDGDGIALGRLVGAAVAAGQRDTAGEEERGAPHPWSGVQAL
jgi:hypothetical protein